MVRADGVRHAHVALGPAADLRSVLEQEEQAQRGEREEDRQRAEHLHARADALQQRVEGPADGSRWRLLRLLGLVGADAGVLSVVCELARAALERALELGGLARRRRRAAGRRTRCRPRRRRRRRSPRRPPRQPVPRAAADQRRQHRGDDRTRSPPARRSRWSATSSAASPTSIAATPTSSHDIIPRSRSHDGRGEHAAELARRELDELGRRARRWPWRAVVRG